MKAHELKERLEESEKLIRERTITWEEKLRKTEEIAQVEQGQDHTNLIQEGNNKMTLSLSVSGEAEAAREFRNLSPVFWYQDGGR